MYLYPGSSGVAKSEYGIYHDVEAEEATLA